MRESIPLREITTEEIWQEVQRLRNELQTHNHLTSGSQPINGVISGDLQSGNYVSGSSGWIIRQSGLAEFKDLILYSVSIDATSTIAGRLASVLASAINASGHFIDAALDTSTKEILGDFTFGESGAIKMTTDADNGLWISPTGILGKKAGATTFSITTSGDATFQGSIASGSTITGVTITGSTLQTGTTGKNVDITQGRISQRNNAIEVA